MNDNQSTDEMCPACRLDAAIEKAVLVFFDEHGRELGLDPGNLDVGLIMTVLGRHVARIVAMVGGARGKQELCDVYRNFIEEVCRANAENGVKMTIRATSGDLVRVVS